MSLFPSIGEIKLFYIVDHFSNIEAKFLKNKGGRADVLLFETIKTNAGTQPKKELQQ